MTFLVDFTKSISGNRMTKDFVLGTEYPCMFYLTKEIEMLEWHFPNDVTPIAIDTSLR